MTKLQRLDWGILIFLSLLLNYILTDNIFSGSIVAVDLILVYSGYLITSILIEQALEPTKFNFGYLLHNLFKYFILPIICISLLIIPVALLFDHNLLNELPKQIIAAFGFSNNYFELTNATRTHFINAHDAFFQTWFVAIIAQFYLGWFLISTIIKKLTRHSQRPLQQMRFITYLIGLSGAVVGLVMLISDVFNQIGYAQLYFSSLTYLLPLSIGSMLGSLYGWQHVPHHFETIAQTATKKQTLLLLLGSSVCLLLISRYFTINHYWQFLLINLLGCALSVLVIRGIKILRSQQDTEAPEKYIYSSYLFYLALWPAYLIFAAHLKLSTSLIAATICAVLFSFGYQILYQNCLAFFNSFKQQTRVQLSWAMVTVIFLTSAFTLLSSTNNVNGATPQAMTLTPTSVNQTKVTNSSTSSNTSQSHQTTATKKVPTTPNPEKIASQLQNAWQKILNQTNSHVEIAVYNQQTHQTYHLANIAETTAMPTASIVKVSVLSALLKQNMQGKLTLSAADKDYAQKMITLSDNTSTTYLLSQRLGSYTATQPVFNALKMTNTTANQEAWGETTTTALDQLKLLNAIYYNDQHYLDQEARTYAQQLMSNVDASQDWGVSAGSSEYQVKNGWLDESDGSWIVNSIGHISAIQTEKVDYTVAILTNQNNSEAAGITLIEQLAQATNSILSANH